MGKNAGLIDRLNMMPVVRHDLKGCPFCGAAPLIEYWHGGKPTKRMITCGGMSCDVAPKVTGETEREAIQRWERRA